MKLDRGTTRHVVWDYPKSRLLEAVLTVAPPGDKEILNGEVNPSVNASSQINLDALINPDGNTVTDDEDTPSPNPVGGGMEGAFVSTGGGVPSWVGYLCGDVVDWVGEHANSNVHGIHAAAEVCRGVRVLDVRRSVTADIQRTTQMLISGPRAPAAIRTTLSDTVQISQSCGLDQRKTVEAVDVELEEVVEENTQQGLIIRDVDSGAGRVV
ncbi:hypothetical protein BDM02DRAFT_3132958 [Thelephora ganbajun]|uniref:Uncharacterized protein n=1 Tax=Thelephora ganbajun TaxID=370292 RepID=A0ACB6YZB6_THEGA|nr:hypothetical protein BDM02DRAFT_3132958 [Thelephora ganbajun]